MAWAVQNGNIGMRVLKRAQWAATNCKSSLQSSGASCPVSLTASKCITVKPPGLQNIHPFYYSLPPPKAASQASLRLAVRGSSPELICSCGSSIGSGLRVRPVWTSDSWLGRCSGSSASRLGFHAHCPGSITSLSSWKGLGNARVPKGSEKMLCDSKSHFNR